MCIDTTNVEEEMHYHTNINWYHRKSKKEIKKKIGSNVMQTFNRPTTQDNYLNITHNTESTAVCNLKPELGVHHWFKGRSARGKQNSQRNKDDDNNNFSEVRDHIHTVPLGYVVDKMTQGWELPEYFEISLPVIISTILHIHSSVIRRLQEGSIRGGSSNSNKTLNCLTKYTYVFRKILTTNSDHISTQRSQTVLYDRSTMFSL